MAYYKNINKRTLEDDEDCNSCPECKAPMVKPTGNPRRIAADDDD